MRLFIFLVLMSLFYGNNQAASNRVKKSESNLKTNDTTENDEVHFFRERKLPTVLRNRIINYSLEYDKINVNYDVDFSGSTFVYEADFDNTHFFKTVSFKNVTYKSAADFINVDFDSIANFSGAIFDTIANFEGTTFYSTIFVNAKFMGVVDLLGARYQNKVEFINVNFESTTNFTSNSFEKIVSFKNAKFKGMTKFNGSKFDTIVDFNNAQFEESVNFRETQFKSIVDFSSCKFNSEVSFTDALFDTVANFYKTEFNIATFENVLLPNRLYLNNCNIINRLDLRYSKLSKDNEVCYIDLRNTPIEKVHLRYDNFKLLIPNQIDKERYEELSKVYERLLENVKERGYLYSYEKIDKEYKEFQYLKDPTMNWVARIWNVFLNWLNKYWFGYGYNKEFIWFWTIGLLVFFALFNWIFFSHLVNNVYPIQSIKVVFDENIYMRAYRIRHKKYPTIHYRLPFLSFYFTCLVFFGLKLSIDHINFKRSWSVAYLLLQFIIGLICLAYLANFVIMR